MYQTVHLHRQAPAKPAFGQPCNGCGVCCAAEPCPLGMLLSLRRYGPCRLLRWQPDGKARCSLIPPEGPRHAGHRWLLQRIGAGRGCDSDARVEDA